LLKGYSDFVSSEEWWRRVLTSVVDFASANKMDITTERSKNIRGATKWFILTPKVGVGEEKDTENA
jgi:hypothetical protein